MFIVDLVPTISMYINEPLLSYMRLGRVLFCCIIVLVTNAN